ncbi:NAD(P)/FAD-dependent oxidoreductase [Streptomyces yatensis]|uniref:FAD-binding oxidoreductase n=1 Tax=Streptomyces yatensis TaxID=155177 RepID=A0ABN2I1V7_9ACTN|nr:FAD-binding oxidoreductase [Streptomyces yatensis]
MRVVVIGAGVVGAAVAAELAARGARVTVLEADHPGAGTTANSFAWINSANKEPEPYFALNHAGMRAHDALAGDGAPWFFPTGNLEWAVTDRHKEVLAGRVARLTARDYPVEWITAQQAGKLEPDLAATPSDAVFAFFPEEAYTLPVLLLSRLLGGARDRGVTVVGGARVTAIEHGPAGTAVICADGGRYVADTVVSCAGRWTQGVAALAGAHVPMADPDLAGSATVGFLATTAPTAARLSRVLTGPRLNVRPDGGGRLLLQALDLDAAADPATPYPPDGEIATDMLARLPGVLNAAEGTVVEKVRVGQRAMPGDGFTVAGFPATDVPFYVVATHSGITLAPLLGRLVADELHGHESPLLRDFRPGRFTSGEVLPPPPAARRPGEQ